MALSILIIYFLQQSGYILFISLTSPWIVFVNFFLKIWCLWKFWLYIFYSILVFQSHIFFFFLFYIEIYQLLNEVEQDEDDGGMAGETFTDYVSYKL
jgi:hypothetical protein